MKTRAFASFLSQLQLDSSNQYTRVITLAIFPVSLKNCFINFLAIVFQGFQYFRFSLYWKPQTSTLLARGLCFFGCFHSQHSPLNAEFKKRQNFFPTCPLFCLLCFRKLSANQFDVNFLHCLGIIDVFSTNEHAGIFCIFLITSVSDFLTLDILSQLNI